MARKYQLTLEEQTLFSQVRTQIIATQELVNRTKAIFDTAQNELKRLLNVHKGGLDYLASIHGINQGSFDANTGVITSTGPESIEAAQSGLTIQDITDAMFLRRLGINITD